MDVTAPGRKLHQKFLALGNPIGKDLDEIITAVGSPSSYSAAGENTIVQSMVDPIMVEISQKLH